MTLITLAELRSFLSRRSLGLVRTLFPGLVLGSCFLLELMGLIEEEGDLNAECWVGMLAWMLGMLAGSACRVLA